MKKNTKNILGLFILVLVILGLSFVMADPIPPDPTPNPGPQPTGCEILVNGVMEHYTGGERTCINDNIPTSSKVMGCTAGEWHEVVDCVDHGKTCSEAPRGVAGCY